MLQVMMIHWKTKLHLSQDSNQLFKISKLTKIVTLCHQENTSKQKYKMEKKDNFKRKREIYDIVVWSYLLQTTSEVSVAPW